jgi:hypothetical protein
MISGCPYNCAVAAQRPVGVAEFSQLSNKTRAEIVLLHETAWVCEGCGSVYVTSDGKSVLLERLPNLGP